IGAVGVGVIIRGLQSAPAGGLPDDTIQRCTTKPYSVRRRLLDRPNQSRESARRRLHVQLLAWKITLSAPDSSHDQALLLPSATASATAFGPAHRPAADPRSFPGGYLLGPGLEP